MTPQFRMALAKSHAAGILHCYETGHNEDLLLDVSTFGGFATVQCFSKGCDQEFKTLVED